MLGLLIELFKISFYLGLGISILVLAINTLDLSLSIAAGIAGKFANILSKIFG